MNLLVAMSWGLHLFPPMSVYVDAIANFDFTGRCSEVDFGTVVWTAHGQRLLADLSYGTIANEYAGRYRQLDNNPAGHSTLIVREAFVSESTSPSPPVTFCSQPGSSVANESVESTQ